MDNIRLNNGMTIPSIGMGTFPLNGQQLISTVKEAVKCGYRMFDTSDNYYNEQALGEGIRQVLKEDSNAKREDFTIVTKLSDELYPPGTLGGTYTKGVYFWKSSPIMQEIDSVRKVVNLRLKQSLENLGTDYIDVWLMHWPYPDYFEDIWREMERVYEQGYVRAIGVSNCSERHLRKIYGSVAPMINQIQSSPLFTREKLVDFCNKCGTQVMIYSPLQHLKFKGGDYNAYHQFLTSLARKYNKSEAQIVLRFDIQRGLIPMAKSSNPDRLKSNIDLFDFALSNDEMQLLLAFNQNKRTLIESKECPGI